MDRAIATIAAVNLAWVVFDVTYVPLRNFWLQRTLYPLPTLGLAFTALAAGRHQGLRPVKGIEPHQDTASYIRHFQRLEATAVQRHQQPSSTPAEAGNGGEEQSADR